MRRPGTSVLVLAGGFSPERNVSFASAANVAANLRLCGYHVEVADLSGGILTAAEEQLYLDGSIRGEVPAQELKDLERKTNVFTLLQSEMVRSADVIFPMIHGNFGEDGRLQALLEVAGVPYVGSDCIGQALAMDKHLAKVLFVHSGIPTAPWVEIVKNEKPSAQVEFPVIIKPANAGSSVGISLCEDPSAFDTALARSFNYDKRVVVEQLICGREFTVGVLDARVLAIGEIRSTSRVFDYQAKYQGEQTEEIFPAILPMALAEQVKTLVLKVYEALRLRHYCRVDFMIDHENRILILEANGVPGMTRKSLYPQSAEAAGLPFTSACDQLCQLALRDHLRVQN